MNEINRTIRTAAEEILDDLKGRCGIGNEIEMCDDEIIEEIVSMMEDKIYQAIADVQNI